MREKNQLHLVWSSSSPATRLQLIQFVPTNLSVLEHVCSMTFDSRKRKQMTTSLSLETCMNLHSDPLTKKCDIIEFMLTLRMIHCVSLPFFHLLYWAAVGSSGRLVGHFGAGAPSSLLYRLTHLRKSTSMRNDYWWEIVIVWISHNMAHDCDKQLAISKLHVITSVSGFNCLALRDAEAVSRYQVGGWERYWQAAKAALNSRASTSLLAILWHGFWQQPVLLCGESKLCAWHLMML